MKPAHAAVAAVTLALTLSNCGLEAERPNIWLQNKSDQTVVLQMATDPGPSLQVTARPHTTTQSAGSPPKDHCLDDWEIVDSAGKVLKKVGKVCAYDTVVYP